MEGFSNGKFWWTYFMHFRFTLQIVLTVWPTSLFWLPRLRVCVDYTVQPLHAPCHMRSITRRKIHLHLWGAHALLKITLLKLDFFKIKKKTLWCSQVVSYSAYSHNIQLTSEMSKNVTTCTSHLRVIYISHIPMTWIAVILFQIKSYAKMRYSFDIIWM